MDPAGASQIYRDLMRFKPEGLSPNAWAVKAGVSRTVWADMRRHGNPSRRTLEKLLAAAGSSLAEFEALRIVDGPAGEAVGAIGVADRSASSWPGARLPPLPLVATAVAGERGDPAARIELTELRAAEIIDRLARPVSLASDPSAYAITIVGQSMRPRFRPGRRVAVSPKAPIAIGDDLLVKLRQQAGEAEAAGATILVLMGELVRRSGSAVELRQFHPDATFKVAEEEIAAIEKIVGELI